MIETFDQQEVTTDRQTYILPFTCHEQWQREKVEVERGKKPWPFRRAEGNPAGRWKSYK